MLEQTILPPVLGLAGLACAFIVYALVKRYAEGEDNVRRIADQIHLGAMVFMRREYLMLALFAGVLIIILFASPGLGPSTAIAFIVGALSSAGAGWIGMYTATKANVRTTTAAHAQGAPAALSVAFFGGSIMGLAVASLGLLGLGIVYYFFGGDPDTAHHIHGFGMGASSVALFSRVGGGIYTKSADVGADLVGKVEAGHSGRRSAQPRRHRRQRWRQRGRRRRHGIRHLRVLLRLDDCLHRHRRDACRAVRSTPCTRA